MATDLTGAPLVGVRTIRENSAGQYRAYFKGKRPSELCLLEEGDMYFFGDNLYMLVKGIPVLQTKQSGVPKESATRPSSPRQTRFR